MAEERERWRAEGKTVALANGVFDLLHVGHVRYLEGAKALADVLVVAVNSDASHAGATRAPGGRTSRKRERAELVAALACTDHVVLFDEPNVRSIIRALKPDVHVKGTDYTPDTIPEADEVRAYGGRMAVPGDPKDHSTTALPRGGSRHLEALEDMGARAGRPQWRTERRGAATAPRRVRRGRGAGRRDAASSAARVQARRSTTG